MVYLVLADDEFIADNAAKSIFSELSKKVDDEYSNEIIEAMCTTADEAVKACTAAIESMMTVSMFSPKKNVWIRNANIFSENRAAKSQAAAEAVEKLVAAAKSLADNQDVGVVISACGADRRKKALKELMSFAEVSDLKASNAAQACQKLVLQTCKKCGVEIEEDALYALVNTVAASPRMAVSDTERLAAYLGFKGTITEQIVSQNVPVFGEGDFFEINTAFYDGDLPAALSALHRRFFTDKNASARQILAGLVNQNSILIQIKALVDSGMLKASSTGIYKASFEALSLQMADDFGGASNKIPYNVFSQNSWYVCNKLAPIALKFSLKRLINFQMYFVEAFRNLIARGAASDESVMTELFVKCSIK